MAGLGTVFVELSLDDKPYKQKLSETLTSTEATAKGLETSWKALGVKSSEYFDNQRKAAQNAYTLIEKSGKYAASEITRAQEAAAAKIKSINEQQYGHQTTLIEGLKKNWIAAAAVITTAMIAVNKAWDLAKIGAEYAEQRGILDNLANKYKTTADDIVKSMQKASDGLIAKADLMQTALGGLAKGLKPEQLINLADAAKILGDAVGKDATTALKDLTEALETGRARGLKTYTGQTISLKDAFGELESKLTDVEKAQAMYDLTMMHAADLQNQQAKAVDNAADKIERMEASYNNATLATGNFFKTIVAGIYDMVTALGSVPVDYDISGMGAQSNYVSPGKAKGIGDRIALDGDLTTGQLAELDMTLLKRQLSTRGGTKSSAGSSSNNAARDAAREAERLAREQERARKEAERAAEKAEKDRLDALHEQAEAQMKLNADMIAGAEKYRDLMAQMNIDMADGHEQAIMRIMEDDRKMYENITKLMDDGVISFDEAMKAYEKLAEKTGKSIEDIFKEDLIKATETFKDQLRDLSSGFSMLSSACMDMAASYEEGSSAAKHWEEAAKAFEIAQRAVAVVQAVAAIATQGLGDPYTAFARVAAMAATMGALLASIGESVSGSSASVAAASQRTYSTALGSEDPSQSIANSLEILQDTYDIENTRLTQIYNEMRDLNNNITGLVTSLVRTGGISDLNIETGTTLGSVENFLNQQINSDAFKYLFAADFLGVTEDVSRFVNGLIGDVFGGETETSITEAGIKFGKTLVENLLNGAGVSAKQYTTVLTEEEGGWFGSDSTTIQDYYTALSDSVTRMITLVYKGISSNLVYIAQELGGDVADVYNYVFKSKKLDLKDMTTDEMNTAINEYFSTISDNAVESLFGDLISQYQELNEGLMETAIRLISDKQTIASILELTNQTFNSTTSQFIKFSEALIDVAGSLDDLTDAFSTYYDAFFTDAEKQADYKKQLSGVMSSYGYSLPTSRTGYRDIVESLDLTTDAGMSAYYALLAVSETADKYYDYLENAASSVSESQYATKVEYLRAVRGYADGGVASGLAWVGENGKELAYFDQPTKIYSNSESGKIVSQGELIAEVRALREDLQAQNGSIATYNSKMAKYLQFLEQWDAEGIPTERAA